jgi:hypothetical protein
VRGDQPNRRLHSWPLVQEKLPEVR